MYFEGNNVDNDWSQGLLQFLKADSKGDGPEGKWGIVVISKSGTTLETAVAFRLLRAELQRRHGPKAAEYIIATTDPELSLLYTEDWAAQRLINLFHSWAIQVWLFWSSCHKARKKGKAVAE